MQKFSYVAVDTAGKESRGVVEANTQAQAVSKIHSPMGMIKPHSSAKGMNSAGETRPRSG